MRSEEFVAVLKKVVRDSTVRNVLHILESPPGRRPKADLVSASALFHKLSTQERDALRFIVAESVDSAIFGLLSVLDGALAIEDSLHKGSLELRYVRNGKVVSTLNPPGGASLHEIYNAN